MPQLFQPSWNAVTRVVVFGFLLAIVGLFAFLLMLQDSSYATDVGVPVDQPIPFSHAHHVGEEGFDCRYCHTTVETSSFAGMPSTQTCMNCHSQIWLRSEMLEPVRRSWREDQPLQWKRVARIADFVYFDHSIHIRKGIGCAECHGRVDRMPLLWKAETLRMPFCLDCHRNPEKYVRPREAVFQMDWTPPRDREAMGRELVRRYDIQRKTDCSVCHR
ncbi:MAG: cytochrome c3 family protein [Candidatus Eisenbacteria bacterium]|nr:cytochrome c3 family protein [Candidatus Eisenbacteria bacterium]